MRDVMELLSIVDISKKTGHTRHIVEGHIKRNNIPFAATEPVGRFPRRLYEAEPIIESLKNIPKRFHRIGPILRGSVGR